MRYRFARDAASWLKAVWDLKVDAAQAKLDFEDIAQRGRDVSTLWVTPGRKNCRRLRLGCYPQMELTCVRVMVTSIP